MHSQKEKWKRGKILF